MKGQVFVYCRSIVTFCVGFMIGFFLCMSIYNLLYSTSHVNVRKLSPRMLTLFFKENPMEDIEMNDASSMIDVSREERKYIIAPVNNLASFEGIKKLNNGSFQPRVLCYLLIGTDTNKAVNVFETWGRRCDHVIFFSTATSKKLSTVVLDVSEGYSHLWEKSKAAITYLHKKHSDFDWYLKADDDTYVIIENLKYFLSDKDPSEPVYFGVRFKPFVKQGFMSGGGGYVYSQEALNRFATSALEIRDQDLCPNQDNTGAEDVRLGQCFEALGIKAGDSRDADGLPRFFSHNPTSLFYKASLLNPFHWYWKYLWHPHSLGPNCCSKYLITFHDVDPRMMWTLESLLYRVAVNMEYGKQEIDSTGLNYTANVSTEPTQPNDSIEYLQSHVSTNPIVLNAG